MSSAAELFMRAARCCEATTLTERQERVLKLTAYHVLDLCRAGAEDKGDQCRLFMELIDGEG